MEKKINDIIVFILLVFLVGSFAGFGIQSYRLDRARSELEYYRTELSNAQNRERQLANTIDECWQSSIRTGEILSESVNTISGIREQIRQIKENYTIMEDRLLQFYDNYNIDIDCANYDKEINTK